MSFLSTPYDGQRRRLAWLEATASLSTDVPARRARRALARQLKLSPEQIRNILRGRLKDLYTDVAARIDGAFVARAAAALRDLDHELALAVVSARGVDPGVVDRAKAAEDALKALIAEADPSVAAAEGC